MSVGIGRFDLAAAAVLTLGSQIEIWTSGMLAGHRAPAAATTLVLTTLLALRRRVPVTVAAVAIAIFALQQLAIADVQGASALSVAALVTAFYSAGRYAPPRVAGFVAGGGAAVLALVGVAEAKAVGDVVWVAAILLGPCLAGAVLQRRHERERELETHAAQVQATTAERAQQAVEDERARIARELHDVVAHAMSVIVVQAGAERISLPPEQESTRTALEQIEATGRQALGEMRRLLGMMRSGDEALALAPQPSVEYLGDLCDQLRSAGLPVELVVQGEPVPLPPGVDVSAYRIVQEALTNALKHAGPASARVVIRYLPRDLEVEVVDDGRGTQHSNGEGHGLIGMQERVSVYGGRIETGNRAEGGYAIQVRLPLQET